MPSDDQQEIEDMPEIDFKDNMKKFEYVGDDKEKKPLKNLAFMETVKNYLQLQIIIISSNILEDINILSSFRSLKKIIANNNKIKTVNLKNLNDLNELDLSNNELIEVPIIYNCNIMTILGTRVNISKKFTNIETIRK